jgi:hypothetical protein
MRIFRRLHATLDRIDETFERNTHAFDRNTQAFDDLGVVIRESRFLQERSLQRFEAAIDDMRAEIRANTDAILKMLDRWGEGPTPAS